MNMHNQLPDPDVGADDFECSPATVMLFASLAAYGHFPDSPPDGVANANVLIDGVLTAAFQNGYPHCDIVRTKMAKGPRDCDGLIEMLEEAYAAAGVDAFNDAFARAGME